MDLWINLRDGRTEPLTGCTAVRSVDTYGTATQFTLSAITSGSANVTVTSTAGIRPGASVFGSGIPTGATVLSITSGTIFVLSAVATATIASLTLTITVVTDADMKLLTVNSGWYRDIFSSSVTGNLTSVTGAKGDISYNGPGQALAAINVTTLAIGVTVPKQSDEVEHAALRQATWLESLWEFTCTTDAVIGPTLALYYRKYDVIGFCNVAPSL